MGGEKERGEEKRPEETSEAPRLKRGPLLERTEQARTCLQEAGAQASRAIKTELWRRLSLRNDENSVNALKNLLNQDGWEVNALEQPLLKGGREGGRGDTLLLTDRRKRPKGKWAI